VVGGAEEVGGEVGGRPYRHHATANATNIIANILLNFFIT